MTKEQRETIDVVIDEVQKNKKVISVILCGSLAKGNPRKASDVDIIVIINSDDFDATRSQKNYFWRPSIATPCEVDGKVFDINFLSYAIEKGNEPIQNTLKYSKLVYCIDNRVKQILDQFKTIEVKNKKENIKRFFALMKSSRYSADDDLANIYQFKKSALDTVLYASRLVLTHNDRLFPCEKNMEKEVRNCSKKPEKILENMHKLLNDISIDNLEVFYNEVEDYFQEYIFDDNERKGYVLENENYWYFNNYPYDKM